MLLKNTEELTKAFNQKKCIVLKFSASWCGPCKNKDFLQSYSMLKNQYEHNTNVVFYELDVDNNEDIINDRAFNFNIKSIPTIKIYAKNELKKTYSGINYLNQIMEDIQTILST